MKVHMQVHGEKKCCYKQFRGYCIEYKNTGLGIRSSVFRANRSFFAKKLANERFALKNERFPHSLIFGERLERFAHGCSFLVSDLSESLMVTHFW